MLSYFLHDEYFRDVLCFVLNYFDCVDPATHPTLSVPVIDVDVAMRHCGALAHNYIRSSREQLRLFRIQEMTVNEKIHRAYLFQDLGFLVEIDWYHRNEFPFNITHCNRRHIWDKIDATNNWNYAPRTTKEGDVLFVLPKGIVPEILAFLVVPNFLAFSCVCCGAHCISAPHLRREHELLKKDLKVFLHILKEKYFREALHLVINTISTPGDSDSALELCDLDIVLMETGDIDFDNEDIALSVVEASRLMDILEVAYEKKKSCATFFQTLGYAVEMEPLGENVVDFSMDLGNHSSGGRYTYAAAKARIEWQNSIHASQLQLYRKTNE